jgi:hypothetical protein
MNSDEVPFLRDHRRLCETSVSTGRVRERPVRLNETHFLDYASWSPDG